MDLEAQRAIMFWRSGLAIDCCTACYGFDARNKYFYHLQLQQLRVWLFLYVIVYVCKHALEFRALHTLKELFLQNVIVLDT